MSRLALLFAKWGKPRLSSTINLQHVLHQHECDRLNFNPTKMRTSLSTRFLNGLVAVLLTATGSTTMVGAATTAPSPALDARLVVRPLTPQDKTDYKLPATTDVTSGLSTVPIGQSVHLEGLANSAVPDGEIVGVLWTLTKKPTGSTAALTDSPLGKDVPTYRPADRLVSQLVGRTHLIPDVAGQYTIELTINTSSSGSVTLQQDLTASTYIGYMTCALCHSGGPLGDTAGRWAKSHHAAAFTRGIDGISSDHYGGRCISCHTVGYNANPSAVNGGFDDIAQELGWTFPTNVVAGNWDAVPVELKALANIQCENCHGPGHAHAHSLGDRHLISVSANSGNCAQCHESGDHHMRPREWENSKHAVTTRYPTGPTRSGCVACHSGAGFVDKVNGLEALSTHYEEIGCSTCHEPHDVTNPHQLRTVAEVTLLDGTKVSNGGLGTLCMNCHMSRRDGVEYAETATLSSHFGPHYSAQADMVMGVNGITYGKTIPSSAHRNIEDTCVRCHMQEAHAGSPGFLHAGGHTFSMSYDGGTPDVMTDDVHMVEACAECHGELHSFDFPRDDYDGDGSLEGAQTEVKHLLDQLGTLLPPIGSPSVIISTNYTRQQARALWNYKFVEEDGSHGVHNLPFAVGLLKASIADLTDDADRDGLSDQWEIANFGSLQAQDGAADSDGDGVNNALELAAGTNPNAKDSDGDGYSDLAEFKAGSDPVNKDDQPGLLVKIYTATEMEFASQLGKTYQVQAVSELTGAWQNSGDPIPGTGDLISVLASTRQGDSTFCRVIEIPNTAAPQ